MYSSQVAHPHYIRDSSSASPTTPYPDFRYRAPAGYQTYNHHIQAPGSAGRNVDVPVTFSHTTGNRVATASSGMPRQGGPYTRSPGSPSRTADVRITSPIDRPQSQVHQLHIDPSLQPESPQTDPLSSPTVTKTSQPTSPPSSAGAPKKEPSSVVIACRQCRARKIKCDSTRPTCNNCTRRQNPCEYDLVPKRRGPDKKPGTRQRSCKKRPADGSVPTTSGKKRKLDSSKSEENTQQVVSPVDPEGMRIPGQPLAQPPHDLRISTDVSFLKHQESSPSLRRVHSEYLPHAQSPYQYPPRPIDVNIPPPYHNYSPITPYQQSPYTATPATAQPSPVAQYNASIGVGREYPYPRTEPVRDGSHPKYPPPHQSAMDRQKDWWANFLAQYSLSDIIADINFVTSTKAPASPPTPGSSNSQGTTLLNFIPNSLLIQMIMSPHSRLSIQPAFLYALLSLANLFKSSSTMPSSAPGYNPNTTATPESHRVRASYLRQSAQTYMESAINGDWIDASLASSALMLAIYESSAHEEYHPSRVENSLLYLDGVISHLGLLSLDSADRSVSTFRSGIVPSVVDPVSPTPHHMSDEIKCTCASAIRPPSASSMSSPTRNTGNESQSYRLPWDASWSYAEIRNEEIRRVCWTALDLVSGFTASCRVFGRPDVPRLSLMDAGNYQLLFPGESLVHSPVSSYRALCSPTPKESIWALQCRSMLLWNFAARLNEDLASYSEEDKAEFAQELWSESQGIEDALDGHRCNLDTAVMYEGREYIFNTRLTVAQILRNVHGLSAPLAKAPGPLFSRKQAESWLYYQDQVIKRVNQSLAVGTTLAQHEFVKKPYIVGWFVNQLAVCMLLFERDSSLISALELAKNILSPVETLNAMWPSSYFSTETQKLNQRLAEACNNFGLALPHSSSSYTVPPTPHSALSPVTPLSARH